MPSVSAEILVRNEALFLEASLMSIRDTFDEIVVVDHGSVDETVDVVEGLRTRIPQLRLHRAGRGQSMSDCRNLAHASARADWAFVWDGDFVAWADGEREHPSLRRFLSGLADEVRADANLVLFHAPNCGPTLTTTIRGKERHGGSGDVKLMRRGTGHFETAQYADTFVADAPLRIHYLNRETSPFFFVHLDRLKLPERLVLRDWMIHHDRDFFGGKTALGFEDWLRAGNRNLDKAIAGLLDKLSGLLVPYDFERWGALPAAVTARSADLPFRVEHDATGAMRLALVEGARDNRLRRYLEGCLGPED
jgi:glycosyltransferase involved in cell wall biosynthesis